MIWKAAFTLQNNIFNFQSNIQLTLLDKNCCKVQMLFRYCWINSNQIVYISSVLFTLQIVCSLVLQGLYK